MRNSEVLKIVYDKVYLGQVDDAVKIIREHATALADNGDIETIDSLLYSADLDKLNREVIIAILTSIRHKSPDLIFFRKFRDQAEDLKLL